MKNLRIISVLKCFSLQSEVSTKSSKTAMITLQYNNIYFTRILLFCCSSLSQTQQRSKRLGWQHSAARISMKDQGIPIGNGFHPLRNVPQTFPPVSTLSPVVQSPRIRLTRRQMLLTILDEAISLMESDVFTDQGNESGGARSPPSNGHHQ